MMWSVVILLGAALSVDSYAVHDIHERLAHGRQLKIHLPKSAEKLEFTPVEEPSRTYTYWVNGQSRETRGRVSGSGNDRRWYIDKVTYEDQGTFTQKDYWNNEISTVKVAVVPRNNYVKHIPGETLYISLEGIALADASLAFVGEAGNVTLVRDGSTVAQDHAEYYNRVRAHSSNIEIRDVNTTDVGRYYMRDRKDRVVSITRMDLTDHHETMQGNPLLALLLLLGIPAGICCCCRKKIFKQKGSSAPTVQGTPDTAHPPAGGLGPAGPPPAYQTPGQPGAAYYHGPDPNMGPAVQPPPNPGQWNGPPPAAGFNPAYPPQNPVYPPPGPAMYPPGPGAPTNFYPGAAPMGYAPAPVMFSPPPSSDQGKEEMKMENMAPSPADPLLTSPPQGAPADNLTSSDGAYQFKIDSSSNFL